MAGKQIHILYFPRCKPQRVEHHNMALLFWKGFVERIRKQEELHNRVVWPYTSEIKIILAPRNLSVYRLRIVCCIKYSLMTILDHDRNFPVTLWAISKLTNGFITLNGVHYSPIAWLLVHLRLSYQELVYKFFSSTIKSWEKAWLGSLLQQLFLLQVSNCLLLQALRLKIGQSNLLNQLALNFAYFS